MKKFVLLSIVGLSAFAGGYGGAGDYPDVKSGGGRIDTFPQNGNGTGGGKLMQSSDESGGVGANGHGEWPAVTSVRGVDGGSILLFINKGGENDSGWN